MLGLCDFWNWRNAHVCNCDLFGSLHLLSLCYWSFFLHTQNHLDSMQVFSSYFSSKFCLSSPCDSLGVVPVTSFSCPVNYCTAHPWLICKHLINSFDLYRHRSNYWTFLVQTISLHSHFIRTWLKLFMCFINVQSKTGHVLLAFKSKQLLFLFYFFYNVITSWTLSKTISL